MSGQPCSNHPTTERELLTERSYLAAMQGGCSIPIFGHCISKNQELSFSGGIISLDGSTHISITELGIDPIDVGTAAAKKVKALLFVLFQRKMPPLISQRIPGKILNFWVRIHLEMLMLLILMRDSIQKYEWIRSGMRLLK